MPHLDAKVVGAAPNDLLVLRVRAWPAPLPLYPDPLPQTTNPSPRIT